MRIDATYTFHCTAAACEETAVDHHDHVWSQHLPRPKLPPGWHLFGVLVFCPRHTLLLQVDGEAQTVPVEDEQG